MKKKIIILVLLLPGVVMIANANSFVWSGDRKPGLLNNWNIGVKSGVMSYFGDLSKYDSDPIGKFKNESRMAYGISLTKQLGKAFGVSGEVIYGGIKGHKGNDAFTSEILEYNLSVKADLIRLLHKKYNPRTGLYGFAGMGQFLFKTTGHMLDDDVILTRTQNTGIPEFVYFAGGGVDYRITPALSVMAELSIRQARNDNLDNVIRDVSPDYYSLFTVGISWSIGDLKNPFNIASLKAYKDLGLTKTR